MPAIPEIQSVVIAAKTTGRKPTIIFLHGIGERGDGTDSGSGLLILDAFINNLNNKLIVGINSDWALNGKPTEFVLIAPQLPITEGEWQNSYIDRAYNHALTRTDVDPTRIALIGISLGGGGVWRYISASVTNAKKFNVAIVICGTGGWSNLKNIADANLPVWAFHAADDNIVGAGHTISAVDGINSSNPLIKAVKTIYPVGRFAVGAQHYIWSTVLDPAKSPGINGETVTIYQWMLMNTNTVHAPVPTGTIPAPIPVPTPTPTTTLKAIAEVRDITATTATLDGSKSEGKIRWQTWQMVSRPTGSHWDVFPGFKKDSLIITLQNLSAGNYTFKLDLSGEGGAVSTSLVSFTVGAVVKAPIVAEADIPPGKTKVIFREDKTFDFT